MAFLMPEPSKFQNPEFYSTQFWLESPFHYLSTIKMVMILSQLIEHMSN